MRSFLVWITYNNPTIFITSSSHHKGIQTRMTGMARRLFVLLVAFLATIHAQVHPDIVVVLNVTGGVTPGGASWADSYSIGGDECYCRSTFDHNIGDYYVETPVGWLTSREICDLLGPGPGSDGRPVYNDIQCGNGPPNDAGDEHVCPGRTDLGEEGCGHIGPKWNFENITVETNEPLPIPSDAHPDILAVLNVTGIAMPNTTTVDSYSIGDRCYCASSFDSGIGDFYVDTPLGWMTVRQVCEMLGTGPGSDGRPVYNDIQCGNGPPNDAGDEHACPGRVDIQDGCGHIGPRWNFDKVTSSMPTMAPSEILSVMGPPSTPPPTNEAVPTMPPPTNEAMPTMPPPTNEAVPTMPPPTSMPTSGSGKSFCFGRVLLSIVAILLSF